MPITRSPIPLDSSTFLIDVGQDGLWNANGVYLIEADRRCLIDGGTQADAPRVVQTLREMGAFPPDVVVLTHSHHDHAQGIPLLREEAARAGKGLEVYASRKALAALAEPPQTGFQGAVPHASIRDVIPLDEGDTLDLGSTRLRVYDVPGHLPDHIAILGERTKNLFVGDAIGGQFGENAFIPFFWAPFWDTDAFYASVDKLRQVDYHTLCLAHFGPVYGDPARTLLDRAVAAFDQWWGILEANQDRLDETGYLVDEILAATGLTAPRLETVSFLRGAGLAAITAWNKLIHGPSWSVGKLFVPGFVRGQVACYRAYTKG